MNPERLYFGYGSNLDAEDWAAWCSTKAADPTSMVEVGPAWLLDHSLRFHYRSKGRGGGAADVVEDSRGTAVPGALFSLSEEGWKWMNRKEGHPKVYRQTPVRVITVEGRWWRRSPTSFNRSISAVNWWCQQRRTLNSSKGPSREKITN